MTIRGSCLCGRVTFQFESALGPFEICHCHRCRKLSGGQGLPALTVSADGYEITAGRDAIKTYAAPVLYNPPAYHAHFCADCGSPLPPPDPEGEELEVPAGLLDDNPGIKPDKHIFVEFLPGWDQITDGLPEYDVHRLAESRGVELPSDFRLKSHNESD